MCCAMLCCAVLCHAVLWCAMLSQTRQQIHVWPCAQASQLQSRVCELEQQLQQKEQQLKCLAEAQAVANQQQKELKQAMP